MAELTYIKNLLSTGTGTDGSLLIPRKIHDTVIEEAGNSLIPSSEAGWYIGPGDIPGSSYDLNRVVANSMDIRVIAEGAEIALDQVEYNNLNIKPLKYGVAIKITREMQEDSKFNLLQHNITYAGKRMAENENSLVITALGTGANTITGGAALTIANLTRGMQYLEDSDFAPTTLFVGMEALNDLRNIDTFTEADKFGSREMLEKGFVGRIYGMNVIRVSTNAGMTTTTSYVTDKMWAYAIVEKRPITVENFRIESHDMTAAAITQRIAVSAVRTSAIAVITTT